jgi:HK97 gp10 family phage protein
MPDGVRVRVDIPDFRRQLREIEARLQRRVVGDGVRAAARVFRDAARRGAPVLRAPDRRRTAGALRQAIVITRGKFVRGQVSYAVTVRASKLRRGTRDDPFYWRFLEGGWIPRGPGRRIGGGERRRALERSRILGGGGRRVQYPFLQPAFDQQKGAALSAFNQRVEARIGELQAVR